MRSDADPGLPIAGRKLGTQRVRVFKKFLRIGFNKSPLPWVGRLVISGADIGHTQQRNPNTYIPGRLHDLQGNLVGVGIR